MWVPKTITVSKLIENTFPIMGNPNASITILDSLVYIF